MTRVILKRGPLKDKVYTHDTYESARTRAYALADLHSVYELRFIAGVITVDASGYYMKR